MKNYQKSKPIPVEGGIKLSLKKKDRSKSWWGRRWIEALESFEDVARLSRGHSYAKRGQVLNIDIGRERITANVQGSRTKPYEVVIEVDFLSEEAWDLVIDALAQKALYTARLLSGEIPQQVEAIFKEVNISLLPTHYSDLSTDCSCPDWSNPCKHVAAVLYLLAEEFGRDPFLLFKARGIDRENFLKRLESRLQRPDPIRDAKQAQENKQKEAIPSDSSSFWRSQPLPEEWLSGAFKKSKQNAALLKSLGRFPFWRGKKELVDALEPIYARTSYHALEMLSDRLTDE